MNFLPVLIMIILSLCKRRTVLVLLLVLGFSNAYSHGGATGIVKQRMDSMVSLKETMKALSVMILKHQDYDVVTIRLYANQLGDNAGEHMVKMFPEGSLKHPSEAKPELWEDWQKFTQWANELEILAKTLHDSATPGPSKDTEKLLRSIRSNCSDCHDRFRE